MFDAILYTLYDVHEPNACFFHDTSRKIGQEIEKNKNKNTSWARLRTVVKFLHHKIEKLLY